MSTMMSILIAIPTALVCARGFIWIADKVAEW